MRHALTPSYHLHDLTRRRSTGPAILRQLVTARYALALRSRCVVDRSLTYLVQVSENVSGTSLLEFTD